MSRLATITLHDARLQLGYGINAAYAIVVAVYVALLFWLAPWLPDWAAAFIIFSDPAAIGFFFLGALMMLERSEGVRAALAVVRDLGGKQQNRSARRKHADVDTKLSVHRRAARYPPNVVDYLRPVSICKRQRPAQPGLVSVSRGISPRLMEQEPTMVRKPAKAPTKPRIVRSKSPKPAKPSATPDKSVSKQDMVLAMLRRQNGASIDEIVAETGWQPHSTRGFLSGAVKKRLGIDVISEKAADGTRRYHIAALKS